MTTHQFLERPDNEGLITDPASAMREPVVVLFVTTKKPHWVTSLIKGLGHSVLLESGRRATHVVVRFGPNSLIHWTIDGLRFMNDRDFREHYEVLDIIPIPRPTDRAYLSNMVRLIEDTKRGDGIKRRERLRAFVTYGLLHVPTGPVCTHVVRGIIRAIYESGWCDRVERETTEFLALDVPSLTQTHEYLRKLWSVLRYGDA